MQASVSTIVCQYVDHIQSQCLCIFFVLFVSLHQSYLFLPESVSLQPCHSCSVSTPAAMHAEFIPCSEPLPTRAEQKEALGRTNASPTPHHIFGEES